MIAGVNVMDYDSGFARLHRAGYRTGPGQRGSARVLLREPERCMECNRVYISLYALGSCNDHDGLEEI
jgi:hypothetical protein